MPFIVGHFEFGTVYNVSEGFEVGSCDFVKDLNSFMTVLMLVLSFKIFCGVLRAARADLS